MEKNTLNKLEYQFLSLDIVFFWASLLAQLVKKPPAMQETLVQFLGWEDLLEKGDLPPTPVFLGFLCGSDGKESACNVGDLGLIHGLGRSPGGGHEKYSSIFTGESPRTEDPGRLQSMGSQRVRHD